ncbi:MAG: nucleotidyltransferase family protein [Planctomycetota bacterium]
MRSTNELMAVLSQRREEIRAFGVRRLALFGSWVHGTTNPESDVDFLVDLEKKTFDSYMGLKFFLEDLVGRRVDLVLVDGIKPKLRKEILERAVDVEGQWDSNSTIEVMKEG